MVVLIQGVHWVTHKSKHIFLVKVKFKWSCRDKTPKHSSPSLSHPLPVGNTFIPNLQLHNQVLQRLSVLKLSAAPLYIRVSERVPVAQIKVGYHIISMGQSRHRTKSLWKSWTSSDPQEHYSILGLFPYLARTALSDLW